VTQRPLRMTHASAPLTEVVEVINEAGERCACVIPCERALTVFVDKQELVTLMTLGVRPEWLVLGYLLNQGLVGGVQEIASITVDWDCGAAAITTRAGLVGLQEKIARRVVTSGCGQGSMLGDLLQCVGARELPGTGLTQEQVYSVVNTIRLQDSVYKTAGSVHGCALFEGRELLLFIEDVGRHNAVDSIAGWMSLQAGMTGANKIFYTTGRLTSEMVIKAAWMGVAVVISRSGITQMGQQLAQRIGMCAIGRATHRRFLCFSGAQRLHLQPDLAPVSRLRSVA